MISLNILLAFEVCMRPPRNAYQSLVLLIVTCRFPNLCPNCFTLSTFAFLISYRLNVRLFTVSKGIEISLGCNTMTPTHLVSLFSQSNGKGRKKSANIYLIKQLFYPLSYHIKGSSTRFLTTVFFIN
jgi:hypothetical protein